MKKLVLNLDKLQVDTFAAEPEGVSELPPRNAHGARQFLHTLDKTCRATCNQTCETWFCVC